MDIETKLKKLNFELPEASTKEFPFLKGIILDNLIYLSGQTPTIKGEIPYKGIVGVNVNMEQAKESAIICTLNLLTNLKQLVGDLASVKRIVKVNGYVASSHNFTDHSIILNAASDLLNELFDFKHARAAIGVASLPNGAPVEIEMVVEVGKL